MEIKMTKAYSNNGVPMNLWKIEVFTKNLPLAPSTNELLEIIKKEGGAYRDGTGKVFTSEGLNCASSWWGKLVGVVWNSENEEWDEVYN